MSYFLNCLGCSRSASGRWQMPSVEGRDVGSSASSAENERNEDVVQRQPRSNAHGDDHCLFHRRQHGAARLFRPIGLSSTEVRDRYLITVFSLIPYRFASVATEPSDRCSFTRAAYVVLALPWRSWPIMPSAAMTKNLYQTSGRDPWALLRVFTCASSVAPA